MPAPRQDPVARFWSFVEKSSGCWEWRGNKRNKYGGFWLDGKTHYAHRAYFLVIKGEDLGNRIVLHSCDNPTCVRPDHLSLGTHVENEQDKILKGRNIRGEISPNSKLTEDNVREIRKKYSLGSTQVELGKEYGVSNDAIWRVVHRKNWKHVN